MVAGSPAAAAQLRGGDVIVEVDGRAVAKAGDLQRLMVEGRIGARLPLRVVRDDQVVTLTVIPTELT